MSRMEPPGRATLTIICDTWSLPFPFQALHDNRQRAVAEADEDGINAMTSCGVPCTKSRQSSRAPEVQPGEVAIRLGLKTVLSSTEGTGVQTR